MLQLKQLIADQKKKESSEGSDSTIPHVGKTVEAQANYSSIMKDDKSGESKPQTSLNLPRSSTSKADNAKNEIDRKQSLYASIGQTLENKKSSQGLSLAARIGLGAFTKSLRAQSSHLTKEKH